MRKISFLVHFVKNLVTSANERKSFFNVTHTTDFFFSLVQDLKHVRSNSSVVNDPVIKTNEINILC